MAQKEKDIELIPTNAEPSGWKVKHDGKEGSGPAPGDYPQVKFGENSGPHLMVLTLPKTGNVTFDANNPIAIKKGNTSPPAGSGMDSQFPDARVFDGGKTLVVLDSNHGASQLYAYTIKANNWQKPLDPIVDNGGGVGGIIDPPGIAAGRGYSQSQYVTAAAIALLVGMLIGYFVHKLFFAGK